VGAMSTPTPPPPPPAGGQDPLLTSLDALVRSGRLSPDAARAALVAAGGGPVETPAATAPGTTPGSTSASPVGRAEAGDPIDPDDPAEAKRLRMIVPFDTVLVALGSALLFAVAIIATSYARAGELDLDPSAVLGGAPSGGGGDGGLDLSIWLLGLLATLLLIGAAAAGFLLGGDRARRSTLVGWPAAFAAISLPSLLVVLFDLDGSGGAYLAGVLIALLGAGGYVLVRQGASLLVAVVGVLLVYGQAIDDIFDPGDGDHPFLWVSVIVTFFVVAVSVAGLVLTPRGFLGTVAGWVSVLTHAVIVFGISIAAVFSGITAGFSGEDAPEPPSYDADLYVTLVLSVLLVLFWSVCYLLTQSAAYRLLVLGMVLAVLPGSIVAVGSDAPSLWQVVIGILGAAALGYAVIRSLPSGTGLPGRRSATTPTAGTPAAGTPSPGPSGPAPSGPAPSGPPPAGPPPSGPPVG